MGLKNVFNGMMAGTTLNLKETDIQIGNTEGPKQDELRPISRHRKIKMEKIKDKERFQRQQEKVNSYIQRESP